MKKSPNGIGKPLRAWSPSTEAARVEFENILGLYAQQIPHDKGIAAWVAYRDMIGQMFPGQLPAPAALTILTIVAANAISSVVDQMESSLALDTPGAVGRRKALSEMFERVLDAASDQREGLRLKNMFASGLAN